MFVIYATLNAEIQGKQFKALVDTGSSKSFIDCTTAGRLELNIKEDPEGEIILADKSAKAQTEVSALLM